MKKLKIILLFSVLIYVYYITSNMIYKKSFEVGNISLVGIIESINIKQNKLSMIINSKEKVLVTYYFDDESFNYKLGDKVELTGELVDVSGNTIFNQFNYKKYLLSQKINHILKMDSIKLVSENKNIFYIIKNKIIEKSNNLKSNAYIKTFVMGDKVDLDNDIKVLYQENGVSHLLAISGMHVTLLSSILLFVFKKIKNKQLYISVFLIFYAFLTSFSPSVIRAVSFFILDNTKLKKIDILLLTAGIMLIYNPYYIYNVGFIFSFIISLFLIVFGYISNKYKNYFVKLLVTSFICFLGSIPIMINNFYYINIMSPLLNIVFVPFVSLIIFPLSLLTLVFPILDSILFFLISILEFLTKILNNLNINIILCHISIYVVILYYIIIIFSLKKRNYLLIIIMLFVHTNIKLFNTNNYLTMIDVGQGDSILLELKDKIVLIDTGGIMSFGDFKSDYSIIKSKTIPYLKSLGIKKIDYLIITHGDYDHIGEGNNLINNFKVNYVYLNSGKNNNLENEFIDSLNKKKIGFKNINKYSIKIDEVLLNFINDNDISNENEDSLIIYTKIDNKNIMLMGDAGKESENYLLEEYNLTEVDILKVGHHGSKNSSSSEFINKIKPKYALISAGINNRFNHPNKETIDVLKSINATTYITSINGTVRINLSKFKIYTCLNEYANRVSV